MKRKTTMMMTFIMSLTMLAGCGEHSPAESSQNASANTVEVQSSTANSEKPSESNETSPEGKTVTIAQSAPFSMGFGQGVIVYENTYYADNFYEPLVKYKDGEYTPCLATEWSASDDGLTYTFKLREGVKFNDGTDFNAQAVKLYFDNMRPTLGASTNYGQLDTLITEITADDDYTVSFHLSRPYYNVLNDLSMAMPRGILAPAAFNEDGSVNEEYLMDHTPGTGPYMFESVNDTATEYKFVKNPNYWGDAPDAESFTVKVIPESKVTAMRAGEVDFIIGSETLDAASYLEFSQTDGIKGEVSDFNFVTEFIALNDEVKGLDDQNVRTAIQMAIDKASVAENIYSGLRTPADSVMPSNMPLCKYDIKTDPLDLMTFFDKIFSQVDYEMTAYISYWFPYDPYTFVANMYPSTDYTSADGIYSTDPQVAKALATMSDDEAKELIKGLYTYDDNEKIQEIYTKALNCANESSVVIPLNYRNEYVVYNSDKVAS